jgi:DNA repair exonuclease SbcCD ATPase subunit
MPLQDRLAVLRSTVAQINQQHEYETTAISRLQSKIKRLEGEKAQLLKAVGLIDRCIQIISANGIGKIESIVTSGLRLVFQDQTIGFVVEKKETARGNSYRLLIRHGATLGNPMDSFGGAVQNVTAFLLRVILIKRFKLFKLLVLDENFSNVGNEAGHGYLINTSSMLRKLCDDHGFTILAISHQPILSNAADSVYRVSVREGQPPTLRKVVEVSELEELKLGGSFESNQGQIS